LFSSNNKGEKNFALGRKYLENKQKINKNKKQNETRLCTVVDAGNPLG
jgi:hypothetical protein